MSTTRRPTRAAVFGRVLVALALSAAPAAAFDISGTVFEDVNYGGGAGRSLGASSGVVRSGARVELFNSLGVFMLSTNTNASGAYSFTALLNGTYTVRVVNGAVTSSRTGSVPGLLPVQTYRMDAGSGAALAVTDRVGGEVPSKVDAGNGVTTLAGLTTATTAPQSITTVTSAGPNVTGVDFGFSFDTIVNVNDSGQGSLRQYLLNSNALGNAGLAIQGQPAGRDVTLFMVSDGQAHPGLRAGITNLLSASGVAVISLASALPAITATATSVDGATQTANVGNTNAVVLGAGGTVGVDALALNQVSGPEVEIRTTATVADGVSIQADNAIVRGVSIYGFGTATGEAGVGIDTGVTGALIENNVLGAAATSFTDPGSSLRNWAGVYSGGGVNGTIRYNLIGFSRVTGIYMSSSTNWTITGNEIRDIGDVVDADGITLNASSTNSTSGNLIIGSASQGFVVTAAPASGNTLTNNTVIGNGVGIPSGFVQSTGISTRSGATLTVVDRNVVRGNYGAGLQANSGSTGTRLTRNSFFDNGTITARNGGAPTGQVGIDLNSAGDNIELGTAPFFTLNDAGDADAGANGLLNFPVLVSASVLGGNLTLQGFARPGSVIELFIAVADASGFGEGATYVLTLTEGGSGAGGNDPYPDTNGGTGSYGPGAINGIVQGTDNTNRFTFTLPLPPGVNVGTALTSTATIAGETSEFGGNVVVTGAFSGTVFEDVNYGGGAGRNSASASGVGRSGARVELYNAAGGFVSFTTTGASGSFSFAGLATGNYTARVVNSTITSSRSGYVPGLMPVQTFRTDASSGTATDVTNRVGGQNPAVADAGNGSAGVTMNTSTGVFTAGITGTAQSITNIALGGGGVAGVDFGFNFDTIVNVNSSGQGSVRQFLLNANALGGEAALAQSGSRKNASGADQALPAGDETTIFMIPIAQLTAGVAIVTPAAALPQVTGVNTILDGTTQTVNVGDTNAGQLGAGGTVGADALALPTTARPEVQIVGTQPLFTLDVQANNVTVRGLALVRGDREINVGNNVTGMVVELNVLGSAAAALADPGAGSRSRYGVFSNGGDGGIARSNLIGFTESHGVSLSNTSDNWQLTANEMRNNGLVPANNGDAVGLPSAGGAQVSGNLLVGSHDANVDGPAAGMSAQIVNNTIVTTVSGAGVRESGAGVLVSKNVVSGSATYGIESSGATATLSLNAATANGTAGLRVSGLQTLISQNRSFSNSGAGIVLVGKQEKTTANTTYGNVGLGIDLLAPAGVNGNTGSLNGAVANDAMNYPVFTAATIAGGFLTVAGYVGSAAGQAVFANATVEIFEADIAPADQNGPTVAGDGTSVPHGEGRTYLGSLVANGSGNFSGSIAAPGLVPGAAITATATDAANNTSELGSNTTVQPLALVKRAYDLSGAAIATGAVIPKGALVRWLLYISNPGPAVSDVSLRDVLDPGFTYLGGTIRLDNSQSACPSGTCSGAEESSIFAAATAGAAGSDGLDGDPVSRSGATIYVGNQDVTNAQLNIAAGRVYAVVFTVRVQ